MWISVRHLITDMIEADIHVQWEVNNDLHRNEKSSGEFNILWMNAMLTSQSDQIRAYKSLRRIQITTQVCC